MAWQLMRYTPQLGYDELCRVEQAGKCPKFELLPLDMLVAVDALQSLNGWPDRSRRGRTGGISACEARDTISPMCHCSHRPPCRKRASCVSGSTWTIPLPPRSGPVCASLPREFRAGLDVWAGVQLTASSRPVWSLPTDQQFSVDAEAALLIGMRGKPRPSGRGRIARTPKASVAASNAEFVVARWIGATISIGAPPQLPAE